MIGPPVHFPKIHAAAIFVQTNIVPDYEFNIETFTRTGTGVYRLDFTSPFPNVYWIPSLSFSSNALRGIVSTMTATYAIINVYGYADTTLTDIGSTRCLFTAISPPNW